MFVLFVVFRHAVIDRCSFFFFFKQKTAYEMRISDWSSDVCSGSLPLTASRISTQPPSDPGTAPRTRIRPRSTSVDTTIRFWVVTRTSPMWPAIFLPFHTRPGSRSEEHTSELQSLMRTSYAAFCLKKKTTHNNTYNPIQ